MESLRYLIISFLFGLVTMWGSEMFFWGFPQPELTLGDWLITYVAYSLCCAAVMSGVSWAGIAGLPALFLGGALLGFLIEGVVVATMYQMFPFQLVWTPLAWHALITGVCVLGLCRAGPHWPLWRHVLALIALGAGGGFFALFWPLDEGRANQIPGGETVFGYLVGIGCSVVFANILLDRFKKLPVPPGWVRLIAPVLALMVWIPTTVYDPNPVRVFWPLMVGLTLWAMRRLGGASSVSIGASAAFWRHALFLIAPITMLRIAVPAWENVVAISSNLVVASITVPLSLGWWLMLLWRASRVKTTTG
jgi:hypothetical protein